MRRYLNFKNLALLLGLTVLTVGYGHVTAQAQTRKQGADVKPTPTPTPTPKPTPKPKPTSAPTQIRLRLLPVSGPHNGGNNVTISGAGFNEQTKVTFGGMSAEVVKPVKPGTIIVVAPGQTTAGFVLVKVTTPGKNYRQASYQYKLVGSPTQSSSALGITQINPSSAVANKDNPLAILGSGFTPETEVLIDGQKVRTRFIDAGKLEMFIRADSYAPGTVVDIEVRNRNSTDVLANGLTFTGPKIFWVDPSRGPVKGGVQVRIYGRYLKYINPADVSFGDVPIPGGKPSDNEHIIDVEIPPHKPGWVDVVIYNVSGQKTRLTNAFYYEEPSDPAKRPDNDLRIEFSLIDIYVQEDGNLGKGSNWSFDIRANNQSLCDLPLRTYKNGRVPKVPEDTFCRRELAIQENNVRIRIIGMRGDTWIEGETPTIPIAEIRAGKYDYVNRPIVIHVRDITERKGHVVFVFHAKLQS